MKNWMMLSLVLAVSTISFIGCAKTEEKKDTPAPAASGDAAKPAEGDAKPAETK